MAKRTTPQEQLPRRRPGKHGGGKWGLCNHGKVWDDGFRAGPTARRIISASKGKPQPRSTTSCLWFLQTAETISSTCWTVTALPGGLRQSLGSLLPQLSSENSWWYNLSSDTFWSGHWFRLHVPAKPLAKAARRCSSSHGWHLLPQPDVTPGAWPESTARAGAGDTQSGDRSRPELRWTERRWQSPPDGARGRERDRALPATVIHLAVVTAGKRVT